MGPESCLCYCGQRMLPGKAAEGNLAVLTAEGRAGGRVPASEQHLVALSGSIRTIGKASDSWSS